MEVRENLQKSAKVVCEEAKIGIRKARQKGMSDVRKQKKGMSQDDARMLEGHVSQNLPRQDKHLFVPRWEKIQLYIIKWLLQVGPICLK